MAAEHTSKAGPRALWKGAISFGLVHVPVALHTATDEQEIDFDWLDKRSMDLVGYKRINKRTGKEIDKAHIVKGVKLEGGEYVLLSDDEIKAAYPKRTQTLQIESFVKAASTARGPSAITRCCARHWRQLASSALRVLCCTTKSTWPRSSLPGRR